MTSQTWGRGKGVLVDSTFFGLKYRTIEGWKSKTYMSLVKKYPKLYVTSFIDDPLKGHNNLSPSFSTFAFQILLKPNF